MMQQEALANRLIYLEQQLESYARLHDQELAERRKEFQECKQQLAVHHQQLQSSSLLVSIFVQNN